MPKHIALTIAASALFCAPAFAQDADTETPPIDTSEIEVSQIDISQIEPPKFESGQTETSWELGGSYTDSVTLSDKSSVLTLDDVTTLDFGVRAERELARRENISLSGALSAQARFGQGNLSELNGLAQTDDAEFRQLGAYADVIARLEGDNDTDWTPFVSAGVGVAQDRAALDNQVFEDLSPVGRYRAGLEKKVSDRVTIGASVGKSFKLD